ARTIIANAEANTVYLSGTNLIVQEYWRNNASYVQVDPSAELYYMEPEFSKYAEIPQVESSARVYREDIEIKNGKTVLAEGEVFAIQTKEYGETVVVQDDLNEYRLNEYLNVLSTNAKAVLVSDNFRLKLGKKIGDTITYTNREGKSAEGVIYGFVDYWTGYVPTEQIVVDGEVVTKDNYLVVAHLSQVQENFDIRPYQVWLKTNTSDISFFYDWAEENGYKFTSIESMDNNLAAIRTDTLFQGTNGILTLSFIIILLLCGVGYLIYWILSIRERELLFGVFRAMGMRKNEILHMLINEQIFSGVTSILFGGLVGVLSSKLYVPMIQITYAAENQVLPQTLITDSADTVKLFAVIAVMLCICIAVLIRNIAAMKITNALKLGED
ncbi:MAG: ABC transporter permease, partial [Lachnospiraceae bacterium]